MEMKEKVLRDIYSTHVKVTAFALKGTSLESIQALYFKGQPESIEGNMSHQTHLKASL